MAASVAVATMAMVCGLLFRPKVDEYLPQYLPEYMQQYVQPSEASPPPVDIPIRIEYRAARCYPTTIPSTPVVQEATIENSLPWPVVILFVSIFVLAMGFWSYKFSCTANTHTTMLEACQETEEVRLSEADQILTLTPQYQELRSRFKKTIERKNVKIADCMENIESQKDELRSLKTQVTVSNIVSNKTYTELEATKDAAEKAQTHDAKKIQNLQDEALKKTRLFACVVFILLLQLSYTRMPEEKTRAKCASSPEQASATITKLDGKVAEADQNEALRGQLQDADKRIRHLEGLNAEAEETNKSNIAKIKELEGQQESTEATREEYLSRISELEEKLEAAERSNVEARKECKAIKVSLLDELAKNEELQKCKFRMEPTIDELRTRKDSAEAKVDKLTTRIKNNEEELEDAKADIKDLRRQEEVLRATSDRLDQEVATAKQRISNVNAAYRELEEDVAKERTKASTATQEVTTVKKQLLETERKAVALEIKVKGLEQTHDETIKDHNATKAQLSNAETELGVAKVTIKGLELMNADIAADNDKVRRKAAADIEEDFQTLVERGLNPLKAQLSALEDDNAALRLKLKNCRCGSSDPSSSTDDSDDHDRGNGPDDDHTDGAEDGEETDDTDPPDSKHQPNGSASQGRSNPASATDRSQRDSQSKKADGTGKDDSTDDTERRPLLGDPESSPSTQHRDLATDETDGDLDVGGPHDSGSDLDTNLSADSKARVHLPRSLFLRPFGWERMTKSKTREYERRWASKLKQGRTVQEAHDDLAFMITSPQQSY